MEQRTDNWIEWRKTGLGASDAPIVMGVSPWSTPYQLWEQKTGRVVKDHSNWATQRGNDMEPRARARIELDTGMEFPATLAEHPKVSFMKASLDGWNAENKIVLEIKCPGKEDHEKASKGEIPEKYWPQLQHQLFVTGGNKLYYYSYSEDENKFATGYLIEVLPESIYIMTVLLDKMIKFWKCVQEDIEPELTDRDYKLIRNKDLLMEFETYQQTKENISILEKRLENLKSKLLSHEDIKDRRVRIGNFKVGITNRKGNIQYSKIPVLSGMNLEEYRSKPSSYQTITFKESKDEPNS